MEESFEQRFQKIGDKELIYKVVPSTVFLVAYANKRNTCKGVFNR